jgi:hypothetical protein
MRPSSARPPGTLTSMDQHEDLREPAPPGVEVDRDLIAARLGTTIEAEAPELAGALLAGSLAWRMEPFDAEGWATVRVVWADTGEPIDGVAAECHWSAVAGPA